MPNAAPNTLSAEISEFRVWQYKPYQHESCYELNTKCVQKWGQGLPLSWDLYNTCGRPGFDLWVGKIPWRRERLLTPVFWPGEFHGLYNLWGYKESDTTERYSRTYVAYKMRNKTMSLRMKKINLLNPFKSNVLEKYLQDHLKIQGEQLCPARYYSQPLE